jgi:hypothetical protein
MGHGTFSNYMARIVVRALFTHPLDVCPISLQILQSSNVISASLLVAGRIPPSWEPQEEGMMSTVASFPSVSNRGLSNQ